MAVTINGTTGITTPDITSDSATVDTTTLVVDDTNNRVGIGTASPDKPLHIYGNTSNNHQIRLQNDFGSGADWTLNAYGANGTLYIGNNLDRLMIDGSGRVTMPYQPMVHAARNAGAVSSQGIFIFNRVDVNVGNHYNSSTGIFTAPVAGVYYVTVFVLAQSGASWDFSIDKNGAQYSECDFRNNNAVNSNLTTGASAIMSLAASDTISVNLRALASGNVYGSGLNGLQIMLVG